MKEPETTVASQFSDEGASPTPWSEGQKGLEEAQIYWIVTTRPEGRPHVTPLIAIWLEHAIYFATGPAERKAKNLQHNPQCVVLTGCNTMDGLDVVVEGKAVEVSDEGLLQRLADLYATKYDWHFTVQDGAFLGEGGRAVVYEVAPDTAFGFGKGDVFSQTRWRFGEGE